MGNNNKALLKYNVIARSMTGSNTDFYHLSGNDGSYKQVNKDTVIMLIARGQVENLRVQSNNGEVLVRGQGVNLTKLPIIDTKTGEIRNRDELAPETLSRINFGQGNVAQTNAEKVAQYVITRRVMCGTSCLGYEVADTQNNAHRISKKKALELTASGRIANATVRRIMQDGKTVPIMTGVQCELAKLPMIVVDKEGKIVDPNKTQAKMYVRCVKSELAGELIDSNSGTKNIINAGDYLLCGLGGEIKVLSGDKIRKIFEVAKSNTGAICDAQLAQVCRYTINIYGKKPASLNASIVYKWAVLVTKDKEKAQEIA